MGLRGSVSRGRDLPRAGRGGRVPPRMGLRVRRVRFRGRRDNRRGRLRGGLPASVGPREGDGARVESRTWQVFTFRDGKALAAVAIPPKPRHSRPSGCRSRRCRRRTSRWSERASSSGGMRVPAVHRVAPHPSCGGPLVVDRRLQREGQLDCDVRALSGTTGHAERSAERLHPVGQAHQAGAVRGIRSAHAVIANR